MLGALSVVIRRQRFLPIAQNWLGQIILHFWRTWLALNRARTWLIDAGLRSESRQDVWLREDLEHFLRSKTLCRKPTVDVYIVDIILSRRLLHDLKLPLKHVTVLPHWLISLKTGLLRVKRRAIELFHNGLIFLLCTPASMPDLLQRTISHWWRSIFLMWRWCLLSPLLYQFSLFLDIIFSYIPNTRLDIFEEALLRMEHATLAISRSGDKLDLDVLHALGIMWHLRAFLQSMWLLPTVIILATCVVIAVSPSLLLGISPCDWPFWLWRGLFEWLILKFSGALHTIASGEKARPTLIIRLVLICLKFDIENMSEGLCLESAFAQDWQIDWGLVRRCWRETIDRVLYGLFLLSE